MKIRQICLGVLLAAASLTCSMVSFAESDSSSNPLRSSIHVLGAGNSGQTSTALSPHGSSVVRGDAQAAAGFYSEPDQSSKTTHITSSKTDVVRWSGGKAIQALPTVSNNQLLIGQPEVVQVTTDSTSYVDVPFKEIGSPLQASGNKVEIIRTQANEDVFYDASQIPSSEAADSGADAESISSPEPSYTESEPVWETSGMCPDMCCDVCCGEPSCCCKRCCCRRCCMLVGGVDAVFLDVETNGANPSILFQDFGTTAPGSYLYTHGSALVPGGDIDDFYVAPRIWAGVQGCKWGIIGRYFHLRAGEHDSSLYSSAVNPPNVIGPTGYGHDAYSTFDAYYTDIELTRNFCCCCSKNQLSFGARYALIEEAQGITFVGDLPDVGGRLSGGARRKRNAQGTGITFGLNGRRPLFCNSCAHWFYSARGSVLWGSTRNEAATWATLEDISNPLLEFGSASQNNAASGIEEDLFIGEVQLGLQWDFALRCLPAKSFFRAAFEYQYWDSSIGSASSGSFAGIDIAAVTQGDITASAFAPGIRADLIGFHVGTGFTW